MIAGSHGGMSSDGLLQCCDIAAHSDDHLTDTHRDLQLVEKLMIGKISM